MSKELEEMIERAKQRGREKAKKEIVQVLIKNGKLTHEEISEILNIPISEVKRIAQTIQ